MLGRLTHLLPRLRWATLSRVAVVSAAAALSNIIPLPPYSSTARVQRMLSTASASASLDRLAPSIRRYVEESVKLCRPDQVHVCDGSDAENQSLIDKLMGAGRLTKLSKLDNW